MFTRKITFHVVATDEEREFMEVEFRVDGLKPILVGMPFPFEGVPLEEHVVPHTPFRAFWEQLPKRVVKVGTEGTILPPSPRPSDKL